MNREGAYKNIMSLLVLLAVFFVMAYLRWPGPLPYGSDTDEHLLVAKTVLETGHFSVGNIHGTKYPPVISGMAILFSLLGLNVSLWMILANCFFILAASIILYSYVRGEHTYLLGVMAAIYLMANITVWKSAHMVIGDVLFVLLVTLVLYVSLQFKEWNWWKVLVAILLAVFSTMVRSVGIFTVGPLVVSLLASRKWKISLFSFTSAVLVVGLPFLALLAYMVYQNQFSPHQGGYLEAFLRIDPYDVSKGTLTLQAFLSRTYHRLFPAVMDLVEAITSRNPTNPVVRLLFVLLAGLLFLASCGQTPRQRLVVPAFLLPYALVILAWPYPGARFSLPLVPVAALGLGEVGAFAAKHFPRFVCVGLVMVFVGHSVMNIPRLVEKAEQERVHRTEIYKDLEGLRAWCNKNLPAEADIVSFDYRELILRLARPVKPMKLSVYVKQGPSYLTDKGNTYIILSDANGYPQSYYGFYGLSLIDHVKEKGKLVYRNPLYQVYLLEKGEDK